VVGRITPAGEVKQFSVPYQPVGGSPNIAAGPDGNIWVAVSGGGGGRPDWILRVTPSGQITRFSAGERPPDQGQFGTGPDSIAPGPDGNMWFTEFWTNRIGRLTPSGDLTEFSIPTPDSGARGIVAGRDGNMWFAEDNRARPSVARITTGGTITEFPITTGPSDVSPSRLAVGADGNLWFAEPSGLAHISPSGDIVQVPLPTGTQVTDLVAGPDANIWFGDSKTGAIARLGVAGTLREFPLGRRGVFAGALAVGADGRIWFSESYLSTIGSIGAKVPEVLMDHRPLVFADGANKTVSIRNTGDAVLAISGVRITGVDAGQFTKGGDSCAGRSLVSDASCTIQLTDVPGGPAGLESALLEISDNASGSPQRLQLLAHVPQCTLPVVTWNADPSVPAVGEQLDVRAAQVEYDPSGTIPNPGYFDRAFNRWLPVLAQAVSPDGNRYAYRPPAQGQSTEIHVVDLRNGGEKVLTVPSGFWSVVAFTNDGIYVHQAYEGIGPDLWLLNPDTGAFNHVLTDSVVDRVDGSTAWLEVHNPADALPNPSAMGGGGNEIVKRDLATGQTTTWLYRPGTNLSVAGVFDGSPVVAQSDGLTTSFWLVKSAGQATMLTFPFDSDPFSSVSVFGGDSAGIWVGSQDGVYLWTPRTGSALVTEVAATPAGTCA
jgi:streptogramin lyase